MQANKYQNTTLKHSIANYGVRHKWMDLYSRPRNKSVIHKRFSQRGRKLNDGATWHKLSNQKFTSGNKSFPPAINILSYFNEALRIRDSFPVEEFLTSTSLHTFLFVVKWFSYYPHCAFAFVCSQFALPQKKPAWIRASTMENFPTRSIITRMENTIQSTITKRSSEKKRNISTR